MKIAIFCDSLDAIGGVELTSLLMARHFNADVYTTEINSEQIKLLGNFKSNIYSLGKISKKYPFRQYQIYRKFLRLNLATKYDFYIISGIWNFSSSKNHHPNIHYIHTPPRDIWDFSELILKKIPSIPGKFFQLIFANYFRFLNRYYFNFVDKPIVVSKNIQIRVSKYFGSNPEIIHPPTSLAKFVKTSKLGDYLLSVNRLVPHKRVELQLEAMKKLPNEKLIIVGSYADFENSAKYKDYLERIKPKNVKIISFISDAKLKELYSNSKGFITTAKDEDFGLTPIEAMASGKPVIAPNEGGYKETIIDGVTGKLIDDINPDKLANAIVEMDKELKKNPLKYKNACIKQAKKFDTEIFIKKIKEEINNVMKEYEKNK